MTIKYQERFSEAQPAGFDGIFDWDFLLPAFPNANIAPMDIDAVIERKGNFLIFETKNIGLDIPYGQVITLEALIRLGKGKIHIMILYGKTPETISAVEEWYHRDGQIIKVGPNIRDANYVLNRVRKWWAWADRSY